jgi:hypothetical protein
MVGFIGWVGDGEGVLLFCAGEAVETGLYWLCFCSDFGD